MKTLTDLFHHEIKDVYSAEKQLVDFLPKAIESSSNEKLQDILKTHLTETKQHLNKVEKVAEMLDMDPTGHTCKAMKGLIEECNHFIKEDAAKEVKDAGIISRIQRIEHYEIAAYGTSVQYATELSKNEVANELQDILNQEYQNDQKLGDLAKARLNDKAMA